MNYIQKRFNSRLNIVFLHIESFKYFVQINQIKAHQNWSINGYYHETSPNFDY